MYIFYFFIFLLFLFPKSVPGWGSSKRKVNGVALYLYSVPRVKCYLQSYSKSISLGCDCKTALVSVKNRRLPLTPPWSEIKPHWLAWCTDADKASSKTLSHNVCLCSQPPLPPPCKLCVFYSQVFLKLLQQAGLIREGEWREGGLSVQSSARAGTHPLMFFRNDCGVAQKKQVAARKYVENEGIGGDPEAGRISL